MPSVPPPLVHKILAIHTIETQVMWRPRSCVAVAGGVLCCFLLVSVAWITNRDIVQHWIKPTLNISERSLPECQWWSSGSCFHRHARKINQERRQQSLLVKQTVHLRQELFGRCRIAAQNKLSLTHIRVS